jgi:hypothetical protein
MSKCQDSGQMVTGPVTSNCGHLTARCGCCGQDVFVVIRPGGTSGIPRYADHGTDTGSTP